jgi:hypothetical protein
VVEEEGTAVLEVEQVQEQVVEQEGTRLTLLFL